MRKNEHYTIPWYKNYMVWMLIMLPLLSVSGSFILLWTAIENQSPVLEGYYKDGLSPKKMAATAKSEHITAVMNGQLLTLKADEGDVPKTLLLKLEHPADAQKDRYITLTETGPGVYPFDAETQRQLRIQRWYVRLYDQKKTWEIKGKTPVTEAGIMPAFELKAR